MASAPLNIAIIGGGLIGPRHAKSVISNPSANLIALVDPAPHSPQLAASLNTTHYASIASLLSSPHRPDAAIICTPNSTHVPLSLELITAGIHVLVEKPISTSIVSGIELVQAAKNTNIRLLVGHHRRFNPYLLATKAALDTKRLGQVIAVQGTWCLKKPDSYYAELGEWRRGKDTGGVILINLIHEVDLLQYLLGPIIQVTALPTTKTRGFEAEEGAAVLMKFKSGVVGTFLISDSTASPWSFESGTGENPMIPHVKGEDGAGGFYRIMGLEGSLSVPDMKIWKGEWDSELGMEKLEVDKEQIPFDLQIEHFVGVVEGTEKPNCTGEEALSAMVVCEAVKIAMATGKTMVIDGFEIKSC